MENSPYKLPQDITTDLKNRMKSLSGQINGIVRMIDKGEDPIAIDFQFNAVKSGLQKAHYLLLDDVYRRALALNIVKASENCPGNCGKENNIQQLKEDFPDFDLEVLSAKLKEIQEIEALLEKNDENL